MMLLQHVPCAPPKRYSVRLHVVERSGQESRTNSHILYRYIIYCGHCTSQLNTPKVPEAQHAWKTRLQSYFLVKVPPQASPALKEKLRPIGVRYLFWVVGRPGPQSSTSELPSEITSCSEAFRPTWSSSESTEYLQDSNSRVCEKKPC